MKKYVLGFLVDKKFQRVLLIRKTHPAWQAGKLNGLGGHIEECESPIMAMHREFREETGTDHEFVWNPRFVMTGVDYEVHVFVAFCEPRVMGGFDHCSSPTDEELVVTSYDMLYRNRVIENLRWMIPFVVDTQFKVPMIYENPVDLWPK